MTTIDEIYAALNPIPARLTEKGKAIPEVTFSVEANAGVCIVITWKKRNSPHDWDRDYHSFRGDRFEQVLEKALAFVQDLPDARQAILHDFMGKLGNLIDSGREDGIEVDYLNPLIDTMKRLSENVITYRPQA